MSTGCPADPAFGSSTVTIDFTKGASDLFTTSTGGSPVTYDPSLGAVFPIKQEGDSPTFTTAKYLFFGRVDVTMRVAPGAGIVSTIVLESDVLDEIDWEFLGGNSAVGQSNYFSKGDTSTYGKLEQDVAVNDSEGTFHTYSVDWTAERIEWLVDGVSQRTLTYASNPTQFPQTPMQVKIGTWCGGCSENQGTRDWAGGAPNWSAAPFNAYYQKIVIQDSSNGVANAASYSYSDQSGAYTSIKVNTGSTTSNSGTGSDNNSSGASVSGSGSSSASAGGVASGTQGAATTLSTATATGSGAGSALTATATAGALGSAAGAAAANGTATTGGSGSSKASATGAGGASQSSPATAGAQKSAMNLALLSAMMFAVVYL